MGGCRRRVCERGGSRLGRVNEGCGRSVCLHGRGRGRDVPGAWPPWGGERFGRKEWFCFFRWVVCYFIRTAIKSGTETPKETVNRKITMISMTKMMFVTILIGFFYLLCLWSKTPLPNAINLPHVEWCIADVLQTQRGVIFCLYKPCTFCAAGHSVLLCFFWGSMTVACCESSCFAFLR